MIDFKALLKYLVRHAWLLLVVPLVTGVLTYFLTEDMPDNYTSEARILAISSVSVGEVSNARQFNYFTEMIRSKSMINVLSYRLIIHDLENQESPFKELSDPLKALSPAQRQEVLQAYRKKLRERSIISPADNEGALKLYDYIKSMGYYEANLQESISVSQNDITGFIDVAFTSNEQGLSVYAVNALVEDFVDYYNIHLSSSSDSRRASLDSTITDKRLRVSEAETQLNAYKLSRGVTGVGDQSSALYERVATYEQNLADNRRQISATKGAIRAINQKIQEQTTETGQSNSSEIVMLDQALKLANQRYVDGGFKSADKQIVDSLQLVRKAKLAGSTTSNGEVSRVAKAELLSQRRTLETELAMLENSTAALESEHRSLKSRLDRIMPADAELQRLQQELDLALEGYTESVGRLNTIGEEGLSAWRLSIVMRGLPGEAQASKRILYVAGAGVAGGSVCLALLFILFLSDRSVKTVDELAKYTNGMPIIGEIVNCPLPERDFEEVWENTEGNKRYGALKNQLRVIRFEIKKYLMESNGKILVVSGLNKGDGKSFIASSLAYSFAISGVKVLLIGDDDQAIKKDIELAKESPVANNFNHFLAERKIKATELITFLKINNTKRSLMELDGIDGLHSSFDVLKREFDLIIIDGGDLGKTNEIKEWLYFADGCLAVCSSGTVIDEEAKRRISLIGNQEHFLGWVFNKSLKVG
ncbi:MAG TPA: Wzz/FepE/Etk N-terminal domain-containing protein [Parapedobacter sp.]|uniref:exopolysaccharide transport family protein n=1 Tax=Parapedobacter sp. TaxID=1958893 RepID=UPI002BCC9FEA|nr:Wzz/FepE/Etk N-terminal domain-containing protein [Parapedobacter sp.]HWK56116.1 Wzz/FepE/Etk N-terminal domain-containing protein [Parapedobacter sp.]